MKMRDVSFMVAGVLLAAVVLIRADANAQTKIETVPGTSTMVTTTPDGKVITEKSAVGTATSKTVIIKEASFPDVIVGGQDMGLRVDHMENGRVVGTLVVRVDGKWQPVELASFNALANQP